MWKCWKTLLGLCTLSLLIKFKAFTANFLARTQPVHYQQVDSTTDQCSNLVRNQAIQSIWCTFEQRRGHVKLFGFLNNFQSMEKTKIREHTAELESTLTVITIKQSFDGDVVTKRTNDVDANYWLKNLKLWKLFSLQYLYASHSVWIPASRQSIYSIF